MPEQLAGNVPGRLLDVARKTPFDRATTSPIPRPGEPFIGPEFAATAAGSLSTCDTQHTTQGGGEIMAQVWLGGSLFVLEAALTGMTFRSDSPSEIACAVAVGVVGAVPIGAGWNAVRRAIGQTPFSRTS